MKILEVDKVSKKYKLGVFGGQTLSEELSARLARWRGKANPLITIGDEKRANSKGEFWALRDISFSLEQGEVLGVIGKNGAGKSTLLKLLSRITAPTSGEIRIKGRMASLLEVGTGFHTELTGRENIFLNGAILGMTRHEVNSKLDEIIAFSGIEHHIDTPVKRYSSGMKVRLGFSVAAHLNPEILVIDEVLAVGDAEFQRKCIGKIQDVAGKGRTVLFVSHNMTSVKSLCSKAILLDNGKLIKSGSVDDIVSGYITENSSDFISQKKKIWNETEAPFSNDCKILEVELKEETDSNGSYLTMNDSFVMNIQFRLDQPKSNFGINFHLINEESIVVFGSSSIECGLDNNLNEGLFEYSVKIPGNLLNSGYYRIRILAVEGGKIILNIPDILKFSVEEGELENRVRYEKRKGVVRPLLDWKVQKLELR